jgi:hypothetical protein
MSWELSKATSSVLATQYWLDYSEYFNIGVVKFGFSSQHLQSLAVGVSTVLDYVDCPWYLYQVPSALSHSYVLTYTNTLGSSEVSYSGTLSSFIQGSSSVTSGNVLSGQGTSAYVFAQPNSYSTDSSLTLEYDDISQQVNDEEQRAFPVNVVVSTDVFDVS